MHIYSCANQRLSAPPRLADSWEGRPSQTPITARTSYAARGFVEQARRPLEKEDWTTDATDVLLMVKTVQSAPTPGAD